MVFAIKGLAVGLTNVYVAMLLIGWLHSNVDGLEWLPPIGYFHTALLGAALTALTTSESVWVKVDELHKKLVKNE